MKKYLSKIIFALIVAAFTVCCVINAPITDAVGSLWSLLPPIVAIGLALITKEVYSDGLQPAIKESGGAIQIQDGSGKTSAEVQYCNFKN